MSIELEGTGAKSQGWEPGPKVNMRLGFWEMEAHTGPCFSFDFLSLLCIFSGPTPCPFLLGIKARIFHIPNTTAETHLQLQSSVLTCVSHGVFHQCLKKVLPLLLRVVSSTVMEGRVIVNTQMPCSFSFLLGTIIGQLETASRLGVEAEITMIKNLLCARYHYKHTID